MKFVSFVPWKITFSQLRYCRSGTTMFKRAKVFDREEKTQKGHGADE